MLRRSEGFLADIESPDLDTAEAAEVERGRGAAKLKTKQPEVNLQGITRATTLADVKRARLAEERHKAVVADISEMAESLSRRKARKQTEAYVNDPKISRWNIIRKAIRRQTEAGKLEQYRRQAADEIVKRGNLLENKERGYEIADEAIESVEDVTLRAVDENPELFTGAGGARLDALGGGLISSWVVGELETRSEFDARFKELILPVIGEVSGKKVDGKLYGNNLFHIAEAYKQQFEEKLDLVGKEFGKEQKAIVRKYIGKVFKLDITLARKGADMYELRPDSAALRGMEKFVNWTQNPIFGVRPEKWSKRLSESKFGRSLPGKALNKAMGLTLGNPILYAYLGNRIAYAASAGAGVATAKALGIGAAAAIGLGPGFVVAAGAAAGAGIYMGIRAAVEHLRGIRRREEQEAIGQGPSETDKPDARLAASTLNDITRQLGAAGVLSDEQQREAAKIIATLRLQDKLKRNLFKVGAGEGLAYDTNYLGVQDLRRAINEFNQKAREKGLNPRQMEIVTGEVEEAIAKLIAEQDKQLAGEISKRGLWGGVKGAATTFAAACLAPGAWKAVKKGLNLGFEALGFQPKFDTSKITFTEELLHRARERLGWGEHYGKYSGPTEAIQMHNAAGVKSGTILELPKGANADGMAGISIREHGQNFFTITQYGKDLGIRIPIDADGHISETGLSILRDKYGWDIEPIVKQVPGAAGGGGRNYGEWMNQMKSSSGRGISVAEVHTKGLYTNEFAQTSDLNELRLHITQKSNGDILIDSNNLLQKGSFRIVGDNIEQPDMFDLRAKGELKYVFIPDPAHPNEAVILDMDTSGNFVVAKGSRAYDLFDPAAGKVRSGVLYGTARVQTGANGLDLYWLNSDKNTLGEGMDYGGAGGEAGGVAGQQTVGYRLIPPVYHGFGGPFVLAGDRRRTDEDVHAARKSMLDKKQQERENRRREALEKINPEKRLADAQIELAEMLKDPKKPFSMEMFYEVVSRHGLDPMPDGTDPHKEARLYLLIWCLRDVLGWSEEQIKAALEAEKKKEEEALAQIRAHDAAHAPAGGGGAGGGGGHGAEHGAARATAQVQTAAAEAGKKWTFNEERGLIKILIGALRDRRAGAEFPKPQADYSEIDRVNNLEVFGPHLTFSADEALLKGNKLQVTNKFVRGLYELVKAEGLDRVKYRDRRFRISISETGPYGITQNEDDKAINIRVPPDRPAGDTFADILYKLKGEGALQYRFRPVENINRVSATREPSFSFFYDPLVEENHSKQKIRNYSSELDSELRRLVIASPKADLFKTMTVKVNYVASADEKKALPDAHGSLVTYLDIGEQQPKVAAQIVFRQIEKFARETKKFTDRAFLEGLNRRHPGYMFDMTDALIDEMGEIAANDYFEKIIRVMETKKAAPGSPLMGPGLSLIVLDKGPYSGARVDGIWTFTFPPGRDDTQIDQIIQNQLVQIQSGAGGGGGGGGGRGARRRGRHP